MLLALLLGEMGHLSSPSRSCLGRLILICGGWGWGALWAEPRPQSIFYKPIFLGGENMCILCNLW